MGTYLNQLNQVLRAVSAAPFGAALLWGAVALAPAARGQERVQAAPSEQISAEMAQSLEDLLGLDALFEILAQEGRDYGEGVGASFFPGRDGAPWQAKVAAIYEPSRLRDAFHAAFEGALAPHDARLAPAYEFLASDLGQKIIALENAARAELLDLEAREAAEVQADRLQRNRDKRLRLIRQLILAGDMIDQNVAGALSGQLAFNLGFAQGAHEAQARDREALLADLAGQEPQLRQATLESLVSLMVKAYAPLSDAELQSYIAFTGSAAGQQLSVALALSFEAAVTPALRALGQAAGAISAGKEV